MWFKYLGRALQVMGLLASMAPQMMADGKITADEAFAFLKELFKILHWDMDFDLPDDLHGKVISVTKAE